MKRKISFKFGRKRRNNKDLQKLCNASIKFTMLNVSKNKIVNFNLEKSISFTGESGIYILYSIVRINSILKNNISVSSSEIKFNTAIEEKLIKFSEVIEELFISYEPAHLTQLFSKFYEQVNILYEEDPVLKSSRVRLVSCVKTVLENGLKILGIDSIEHM